MAQEIKNTFLKSKMNKDLDDRILPNGEYRDARNISVGRSEDSDVGALENVIGNDLVTGTDLGEGLTVIGVEPNNSTDEIFVFLTDYTDPSTLNPTNAPVGSKHYIYVYNNSSGEYTKLVQGIFLNFSTTNRILGINLLENLLFWTDNRNQPRKINVNLATSSTASEGSTLQDYYTQEHQISVAKYSPYQAISLYNRVDVTNITTAASYITVLGDRVAELTPYIGALVVSPENLISGNDYIKVTSVALQGSDTRVSISPSFSVAAIDDTYFSFIQSTMTNKNDDDEWPGDPDYLEDRFVRFSYRFKFDDNEYSIMAPFTQIAYIPKQNGYFINGDEDSAYRSTIVDFMENLVQNIGLVIPLPTSANRITSEYKISELEILFRESDSVAVKVLESVTAGEISGASATNNYYAYDYQSRKPYRTLPEAQTVRVYDKVPVRAFSQESSGNRIIYGNYRDQHTPPANLNYNCRISPKSVSGTFNNFVEYPNHTVKRNRNYQAGFILADKFGRQSPVILSSVDAGVSVNTQFYSGSTIYSPYDLNPEDTNVRDWMGDAISLIINSPITSRIDSVAGTPGLYAIEQQNLSTGEGFAITGATTITETTYQFRLDATYPDNINIPAIGDFMRGYYEDFVKVTNVFGPIGVQQYYTVTTTARVNDSYLRGEDLPVGQADLKFAYSINDLGWYSYKIVVKQTEQEYYNVYLPGILNGYPGQSSDGEENGPFPNNETNLTAHAVLFNDNINKVPRDLLEVGDQDKQFRSSVTLYGRVTNTMVGNADAYNQQYYPRLNYTGKNAVDHMATTIATASDLDMAYSQLSGNAGSKPRNGNLVFYQIDSNPLIARISTTEKSIGVENTTVGTVSPYNMLPYLAVYETAPVESLLDIYWETTSEGLIVDLNSAIAQGSGGAVGFTPLGWSMDESIQGGQYVTDFFEPIDREGNSIVTATEVVVVGSTDGNDNDAPLFEIYNGVGAQTGSYKLIYTGGGSTFISDSAELLVYTITIKVTTAEGDISELTVGGIPQGEGAVQNLTPSYTQFPDFQTTKDTTTIISAADWVAQTPVNGSADTSRNRLGLQYDFTGPANWSIDRRSGQITQNTPTPNGTYAVDLILYDASGLSVPGGTPPYGPMSVSYTTNITIGYPQANTEALSTTCLLTPTISQEVIYPTLQGATSIRIPQTGIWYIIGATSSFGTDGITIPPNEPTPFEFRIGTGAHTSGTLAFTINAWTATALNFKFDKAVFYYRIEGQTLWNVMQRSNEYNKAGLINSGINAPTYDNPYYLSNTWTVNGPNPALWLQAVRAIDYASFNQTSGVEYAIVIESLTQDGGGLLDSDRAVAWVNSDDLHYPGCSNRQGVNIAPVSRGGSHPADSYEYFRSIERNSVLANPLLTSLDLTIPVYAETPYGEYVNQFYLDQGLLTPYTPASNQANYIDFMKELSGGDSWTSREGVPVRLQWTARFNEDDGVRMENENAELGVNTIQTTPELDDGINVDAGTLRVNES
jgi:hypothetical protein